MNNLDKEFNKRFQYKKSSSDDFEMEDLWSAVEKELDDNSGQRGFYYYLGSISALLFLLLVSGFGFWMFSSGKHDLYLDAELVKTKDQNIIDRDEYCPEIIENRIKSNSKEDDFEIINTATNLKKDKSVDNQSEIRINENANPLDLIKQNTASKTDKLIKESAEDRTSSLENISFAASEQEGDLHSGDYSKLKAGNHLSINNKPESKTELVQTPFLMSKEKPRLNPKALVNLDDLELQTFEQRQDEPKDDSEKIAFVLGLNGGLNWNNQNYEHSGNVAFANLKNSTESGDFGQSYGLDFSAVLKDRWIIQSGLEYHKFWSKFDYSNTSVEPILKENQLTTIWLNGTDTLGREFTDVVVNRTTNREVVHHNQYAQLSIPLEFGIQNSSEKLTYGITVGAAFNFLLNQSGKVFDEIEGIVVYDENSNNQPLSDFKIGMRLSPFIAYHLTDNASLALKPNLMLQQQKAMNQSNLSANIQQFGLKLGLQLGF